MKRQIEMNLGFIQEKLKGAGLTDKEISSLIDPIRNEMDQRVCGLVWQNQTSSIPEGFNDSLPYFEHQTDKDIVGNGDNNNLLIEGDNLYALLGLQYTHIDPDTKKGMIDCIYIDPPYNTGNVTFGYNDKFEKSEWLSMMDIRLKLAKNLLTDDGVIFISIDDAYEAELKLLCDDIFDSNLLLVVVVNRPSEIATSTTVQKHEYCLAYAKNLGCFASRHTDPTRFVVSRGTVGNEKQTQPVITFPAGLPCYGIPDGTYAETRKIEGSKENIKNLDPIIVENGMLSTPVRMKARWRSSNDMRNFFKNDCKPTKAKISGTIVEIYFDSDKFNPQIKKATSDKLSSLYLNNVKGSTELNKMGLNFTYPKCSRLIHDLFKQINLSKSATVLDFFAGSGTTGQAILELNAEDKGHRHFILCTNNEIYDSDLRKKVDKEIKDAGSSMTEYTAAKLYAEIGVCHHVTYPRMQNVFVEHPNSNLRYMKVNTDIKETGLDDADVRNVINEFVSYVEIKENAYVVTKCDMSYMLTNETRDVLVFSADENDSLIPYLKAKRMANKQFPDDGKEHVVYCEINEKTDADGIHFVPYPAQVLNRIKVGKKFVKREEVA
ncbi:MAG: site-specific DNA-methyltransferase [Clostridiales bacterium]|nr:site-specific DNA-methyltransferase [Clostridiales bacterium]